MNEELEKAEHLLCETDRNLDGDVVDRVEAAEKAVTIAKQQLAGGAIRAAQV